MTIASDLFRTVTVKINDISQQLPYIVVNQADDNGKIIRFVPMDHGQKVTGFTGARLYYPPRSDHDYGDYVTGVEADGAWDFTIPVGALSAGRVECNLAFADGNGETYSRNVVFLVEPAVSGVFDPEDGQQTRIDKIIGTVQDTADTAIGSINKTASDAVDNIGKAEESINESVTAARGSADAAANSEQQAAASASTAQTSERNAANSAMQASQSATAAKQSETNAAASERNAVSSSEQAANIVASVSGSVSQAENAARSASQSATAAAGSASAAGGNAQAAAQSASDASASASAAKASETSAASSASAAKTSETNAAASATAAAQSASQAQSSATAASTSAKSASTSAESSKTASDSATSSKDAAAQSATEASASASAAQQAVDGFGLNAGTTTTGEPGSDAAVNITKQGTKYVADFTIPRGPQGPKGDPGDLKTVAHDNTLTGNGTSGDPLGVNKYTVLSNNVDFNNVNKFGFFLKAWGSDATNTPFSSKLTQYLLFVTGIGNPGGIIQIIIPISGVNGATDIYFRYHSNAYDWSTWKRLVKSDDLSNYVPLSTYRALEARVQALEAKLSN